MQNQQELIQKKKELASLELDQQRLSQPKSVVLGMLLTIVGAIISGGSVILGNIPLLLMSGFLFMIGLFIWILRAILNMKSRAKIKNIHEQIINVKHKIIDLES